MTPFSASNQGGMTDAITAHKLAPAPSLPAFSIPAPRLNMTLAPFALAAHKRDAERHVEDGPVAFSIAALLLDSDPQVASHPAYDMAFADFDELIIGAQDAPAEVLRPDPDADATFDQLADLAPKPLSHQSPDLLFPAINAAGSLAAEPALIMLLKCALRTRITALGRIPRQRSVQDWVFLMLAFAVMSLLAAPPLVAIFLALHGVKP